LKGKHNEKKIIRQMIYFSFYFLEKQSFSESRNSKEFRNLEETKFLPRSRRSFASSKITNKRKSIENKLKEEKIEDLKPKFLSTLIMVFI